MEKQKINNINIIIPQKHDTRPILHNNIINIAYPIFLLLGKKGSGK
jgi:hypothetical protein